VGSLTRPGTGGTTTHRRSRFVAVWALGR